MPIVQVQTERLVLRQWRDDDLFPFAAMNADPEVMHYLPAPLTPEQSADFIGRQQSRLAAGVPGLYAVEVWNTATFIGFIGLSEPTFDAPFTPCVEIGWRLTRSAWGQGYATEGAGAVLKHAWTTLGLDEVVSFTYEKNRRSRAVMERLGMRHDPREDFVHPALPADHRLSPHVLYRKRRPER